MTRAPAAAGWVNEFARPTAPVTPEIVERHNGMHFDHVRIAHVPCIALSASGMADEIAAAELGRSPAYLTKPPSFSLLRLRVDTAL